MVDVLVDFTCVKQWKYVSKLIFIAFLKKRIPNFKFSVIFKESFHDTMLTFVLRMQTENPRVFMTEQRPCYSLLKMFVDFSVLSRLELLLLGLNWIPINKHFCLTKKTISQLLFNNCLRNSLIVFDW